MQWTLAECIAGSAASPRGAETSDRLSCVLLSAKRQDIDRRKYAAKVKAFEGRLGHSASAPELAGVQAGSNSLQPAVLVCHTSMLFVCFREPLGESFAQVLSRVLNRTRVAQGPSMPLRMPQVSRRTGCLPWLAALLCCQWAQRGPQAARLHGLLVICPGLHLKKNMQSRFTSMFMRCISRPSWVAVQELKSNCHISETPFSCNYPCRANLNQVR